MQTATLPPSPVIRSAGHGMCTGSRPSRAANTAGTTPPANTLHTLSNGWTCRRPWVHSFKQQHSVGQLPPSSRGARLVPSAVATAVDLDKWVKECNDKRLDALEEQAMEALRRAVEGFERPAFPCAFIAGDVCILHLLHRLGYLSSGQVKVIFIDTFHLFDETHALLRQLEEKYGFKAHEFHAAGFADKAEYKAKHGSDLFLTDIEQYDQICKVEPFSRSLAELKVDCMINGRRRDHGFERAFLEIFEAGEPVKCQPLAYWTFADCFAYLDKHSLERHPLHDQGFPSVGDVHSTVPVPKDKWFEYAGERSGRFQGLSNPDGSLKTECGIHSAR